MRVGFYHVNNIISQSNHDGGKDCRFYPT